MTATFVNHVCIYLWQCGQKCHTNMDQNDNKLNFTQCYQVYRQICFRDNKAFFGWNCTGFWQFEVPVCVLWTLTYFVLSWCNLEANVANRFIWKAAISWLESIQENCRSLKIGRGDDEKTDVLYLMVINIDFRSSEIPLLSNNGTYKSMC